MEKLDYKEQERKIKELEKRLFSMPIWGDEIKMSYHIGRHGPPNNRQPSFGFKEGTTIPREVREICYESFQEYFPDGVTTSL